MEDYDKWFSKVKKIAEVKYDISEDILVNYRNKLAAAHAIHYNPVKTVEMIAEDLFG